MGYNARQKYRGFSVSSRKEDGAGGDGEEARFGLAEKWTTGGKGSTGAPICNIVLQHFCCNMADAIRTTPQETLFGSLLLLWFLPLVLAGCCCQLVCFEFDVLRWSCRLHPPPPQINRWICSLASCGCGETDRIRECSFLVSGCC